MTGTRAVSRKRKTLMIYSRLMMKEITQPDIPPEVKDVRVMSLHKSKGLSSPLMSSLHNASRWGPPQGMPKQGTPKAAAECWLVLRRRAACSSLGLRVLRRPTNTQARFYLTYAKEMYARDSEAA